MSIYSELKAAGVPIDSHEADLYAKVTPESEALIARYQFRCNVTQFRSQIDGAAWYDIPFAYEPFWEKHCPNTTPPVCCSKEALCVKPSR